MSRGRLSGEILVTGAGGFLGRAVLGAVEASGRVPRVFYGLGDREIREDLRGHVGDIDDPEALRELLDGVDAVIHLAGPPAVAMSYGLPAEYLRIHAVGTARVVEACRQVGVRRWVYVSSAEVYGAYPDGPVDERAAPRPHSPYAVAKLAAEGVVESCARGAGFEAVILRPFSIYGPGASPLGLIPTILCQASEGDEVVLADLRPVRDYCFVEDAADAAVRAATRPLPKPVITYNVGSGRGTSVRELAKLALRVLGRDLPIRQSPRSRGDRPTSAYCENLIANPRRIYDDLGWKTLNTLEDGLRKTSEAR